MSKAICYLVAGDPPWEVHCGGPPAPSTLDPLRVTCGVCLTGAVVPELDGQVRTLRQQLREKSEQISRLTSNGVQEQAVVGWLRAENERLKLASAPHLTEQLTEARQALRDLREALAEHDGVLARQLAELATLRKENTALEQCIVRLASGEKVS